MAKMKVHELAKELEIQSKDIIVFLQEKGIEVKAAQSSVEDEHVAMVKGHFSKGEAKAEEVKGETSASKADASAAKAEAPKKKKNIIFVSNPQNSKMPGSRPMSNQNKKPAQPQQPQQAPAKQATVKPIQLGPNQMINKATGKIMEKLPPKQEVKEEVVAPVKEEVQAAKPKQEAPRYLNRGGISSSPQQPGNNERGDRNHNERQERNGDRNNNNFQKRQPGDKPYGQKQNEGSQNGERRPSGGRNDFRGNNNTGNREGHQNNKGGYAGGGNNAGNKNIF